MPVEFQVRLFEYLLTSELYACLQADADLALTNGDDMEVQFASSGLRLFHVQRLAIALLVLCTRQGSIQISRIHHPTHLNYGGKECDVGYVPQSS